MGDALGWAIVAVAALTGGLVAAVAVRLSIGRRLGRLAEHLDGRVQESDFLARLPEPADDEVGRIAGAFNRLLARITTLQGDVIDQSRELESTQRALALAEELAEKQRELEQRLRERQLLFEVLRESTSSHDLDRVLEVLVTRMGEGLRADRLAVLLDERGQLRVRAAFGWAEDENPVGELVARPSGGPWAVRGGVTLVPDVARAPGVTAFWAALPASGSFAAVPIAHRDERIGLLVLTRSEDDPLSEIVARYLEAVADQAAMAIHNAQLIEQLEDLSTHDELTGLPNRRLFHRRLARAFARAERYGHEVSVLALDIDHFKQLNDRHGHPAGDAALRALAEVLVHELREVDTVARAGGEELWVLLPETATEAASEVAEKLLQAARKLDLVGAREQPLGHFSVSIGAVSREPDDTPQTLLARADEALYEAKRSGRDRAVVR